MVTKRHVHILSIAFLSVLAACEDVSSPVNPAGAKASFATGVTTAGPVAAVRVTLAYDTVQIGDTLRWTAAAVDANGQAVTSGVTYLWGNPGSDLFGYVAKSGNTAKAVARIAGRDTAVVTVSASSGTFKGYGHLLIVAAGTTPPGDPTPVDTSSPPDTTAPLPPPPSSAGDSVDRTCTGCVVLSPGANLQSAVTNRAAGTGFRLTAGVYRNQRVVPKSGNRFVCDPGAVLDGGGTTVYAFEKGSGTSVDTRPKNVTIVGCEVTRYASPDHYGPIRAGGSGASDGTYGWTIDGVNCHHNRVGCVRVGHKTVVRNSWLHHNGWAGIIGAGDSILIEHNEISYNDVSGTPGISLGGSNVNGGFKFVNTRWLVVRNNFSHHNRGAGMWTDINNIYTTYDGNRVEDNTEVGIFHEISYDAVIKNNVVRRNGFAKSSWLWGAGILVAASPNVEVSGNTLAGNYNGIAVVQQNRTESAKYGPHVVNNVRVHDNSVDGGRSGFVQDVGNSGLFTLSHVKFWRNTYTQRVSSPFAWANGWRTGSQWRGYGQDTDGTFTWQ